MASVLLRNVTRVRLGKRLRNTRITARTSDERYIMTSRARLDKVLEELQKNPYYDKYAGKIAKLQQTSPEEFLQRVEQQENARDKKVKKKQAAKLYQTEAKPILEPDMQAQEARLSNIMKVDMIKDKTKEEIIEIWKEYHKQKDCICGTMTPEQYDTMFARVKYAIIPNYQFSKLAIYPFLLKNVRSSWSQTIKRQYVKDLSRNKYITTPIFYVNAGPHIGHLYSAVLADAITRYNTMLGHKTFLTTGTDEHGNKIKAAAAAAGLPNLEYCNNISQQFREMCDRFEVDYSRFIRTTEKQHYDAVHHFWKRLEERGHIYLGKYSGWYCVSDEAFLSDTELVEQRDLTGKIIKVSAQSGNTVEWTEEENYKFRLSAFQDDLRHWLKDENVIRPALYHKILSEWIEEGTCLQDLSITRIRNKVPWAMPSPCDESHSIYVWMDALINYLTALGYPDESFKEFWPPTIQVIGKDILKFHGVYWPAFLIAAGLEPPKTLLCHAHWTVDHQKMSKSKGNVISPFEAATDYSEDGLRYFILREAVPQNDANYSSKKIVNVLNSELADTLGNLVNRCAGKTINPSKEFPDPAKYWNVLQSQAADETRKALESVGRRARESYEEYNLHHVVDAVMSMLHCANKMVDYHEPWQLRKQVDDTDSIRELKAVISFALESSRIAALILYPITPRLSSNLLDFLDIPRENRTWTDTVPKFFNNSGVKERYIECNNVILFKKIRSK